MLFTFVIENPSIFKYENLGVSFFHFVKVMADLQTDKIFCRQIIDLCLVERKEGLTFGIFALHGIVYILKFLLSSLRRLFVLRLLDPLECILQLASISKGRSSEFGIELLLISHSVGKKIRHASGKQEFVTDFAIRSTIFLQG